MRRSRSRGRCMRWRRRRRSQSRSRPVRSASGDRSRVRRRRKRKVRRYHTRKCRHVERGATRSRSHTYSVQDDDAAAGRHVDRGACRSRSHTLSVQDDDAASVGSGGERPPGGSKDEEILDEDKPEGSEDEQTKRIWVASSDCARIVGKGGRTMRDTEAKSRTKLHVQREGDEENKDAKERYIDIRGSKKEVAVALHILLELASFCRLDDGSILKEKPQEKSSAGNEDNAEVLPDEASETGNMGDQKLATETVQSGQDPQPSGPVEADKADAAEDTEEVPEKLHVVKIWVKNAQAGRVIGRGGQAMQKVMEKTGAQVQVQKSEHVRRGCSEREVFIAGKPEQREDALQMILAEVTWARDDNGILKSNLEEDAGRNRRRRGSRGRRRDSNKDTNNTASDGVRGSSAAHADTSEPSGLWVCGSCGGDHRTKECPQRVQLGMGMQLGMQMAAASMPGAMPPMGMPMPGLPMMGMPGLPMGFLPPPGAMMHPGMGRIGKIGRSRRRKSSRSSSEYSCSEGAASDLNADRASSSGSGSIEPKQDAPMKKHAKERLDRSCAKQGRSRSQRRRKTHIPVAAAPSDATPSNNAKIDFTDL